MNIAGPGADAAQISEVSAGLQVTEVRELPGLAGSTDCVLGDTLLSFDHNGAVWTRAKSQVGMTPKIVGTFRF